MVTEAFVLYIKGVYLGFERKVREPFCASSILESWYTSALGSHLLYLPIELRFVVQ